MKKLMVGGLAALGIAALGAVLYLRLFPTDSKPAYVLSSHAGQVEYSLDGESWRPVEMKMRLSDHARIRTAEHAEATLAQGSSHLTVRPGTEILVADLREGVDSFRLEEGEVRVEARDRRLKVRGRAGQLVDASEAGFGMTVLGDGIATVHVTRGTVRFEAANHVEEVAEGQTSFARPGSRPSRPVEIPETILANIKFPDAEVFNVRLARIEGRVPPGHRVRVDDKLVDTDDDGVFAVDVTLKEGYNRVQVVTNDPLGRKRVDLSPPYTVDTSEPELTDLSIGPGPREDGG
ncbi:MAG: hypothetical protein AAF533_17260 [Acidobacteriota bacterium]